MKELPFTDYSTYIAHYFPDFKIQKISVNAGFSCPNRDGTVGTGGCIYCDNSSFTPAYCLKGENIVRQIEEGKRFFARKYPDMKYLAYFQSFTSTHSDSLETIRGNFLSAAAVPDVVGIIIGTRPDSLSDSTLDMIEGIAEKTKVFIELGAESSFDSTLETINRGHTWDDTVRTVEKTASRKIPVGLHLIIGLPGESDDMILETVEKSCRLPIESLKLHQLQIIKNTPLHKKWLDGELKVRTFTVEQYLELCEKIIEIVPRRISIERFLASSPPDKVVSPKWGLKNYQFMNLLINRLK